MSMRISERIAGAGLICLALASCDSGAETADLGTSTQRPQGIADCAIGADALWHRDCPVEQAGETLTFRHADGGFRRFRIVKDGRGLTEADGAEQARVAVSGEGRIDLAVGTDRYRLPATTIAAMKP